MVIRVLQELTGYCNGIKKTQAKMTATLSEIKILREPTVEGMKLRIKSTIWKTRKEKSLNQNRRKKKRIHENKDRLRNFWDVSKRTNIQIIRVPKGDEEE